MRTLGLLWMMLELVACASVAHKTKPRECGSTPINVRALEKYGVKVPEGKIVVARIFATWCPYCKDDFAEIGKRFQSKEWREENVHTVFLNYKNRADDKASFDDFVARKFPTYGIPTTASQLIYIDKEFKELAKDPLFEGWKGVPFGLVFGKDGRLAFQGHFTNSPKVQDGHYQFISDLTVESCKAR